MPKIRLDEYAGWRVWRKRLARLGITSVWAAVLVWPSGASQPMISKIEPFGSDQVLVHFDVQPNTTCVLQWTAAIRAGRSSGVWSNLWISPNLPFFEHYIIPDTRAHTPRFYRLRVSP